MKEIKLAVVVPSCRDWKVAFGCSLVGLVRHLTIAGINHDINVMQGASNIVRARRLAIEWARGIGATHLLCIDDDMVFHSEIAERLLARDLDIVGCNYVSKATHKALMHDLDGKLLDSTGRSGIQEIGWMGFGMALIRLEAIRDLPKPWFGMVWLEDRQDDIGEDFFFCKRVREHGLKIYVDHDASQLVGHIGDQVFGFPQKSRLAEAAE